MAEISETRFGDICSESAFGPRFSSDNYAPDGNVATLRTTDMRADGRIEYSSMPLAKLDLGPLRNHILRRGDLCITRTGRVGTTTVFEEFELPVLPGAFLIRFRLNPAVADPLYYQYFFNSQLGQQRLLATASGSVQQNLNITALHEVQVPLPPLGEQKEIAGVLGSLDDKIGQNRRTGAKLEGLARAVFKAWFVDFEPVKAKAAGATAFPGMHPKTFAALPNTFQDSPLGPVPQGWEVGTMGSVGEQRREQVAPDEVDGDTPYIGLEHMPRRDITLSDWGAAASVTSSKFRFRRGDILFGKLRPYFHKVGPAPLAGVCSTDIVVLYSKHPDFGAWLLMLVSSDDFVAHTDRSSAGTKMPRTNWKDMAAFVVTIPPPAVVKEFQKQVSPLLDLIDACIHESRKLATLRDYLLPRLLSGRVRVGETTRTVRTATAKEGT